MAVLWEWPCRDCCFGRVAHVGSPCLIRDEVCTGRVSGGRTWRRDPDLCPTTLLCFILWHPVRAWGLSSEHAADVISVYCPPSTPSAKPLLPPCPQMAATMWRLSAARAWWDVMTINGMLSVDAADRLPELVALLNQHDGPHTCYDLVEAAGVGGVRSGWVGGEGWIPAPCRGLGHDLVRSRGTHGMGAMLVSASSLSLILHACACTPSCSFAQAWVDEIARPGTSRSCSCTLPCP